MIPQVIYFMLSYAIILVIGYLLINFLSNGFFNVFILVKASRGRKTLVKIVAVSDTYYRSGEIDGIDIVFKNRKKDTKRIKISREGVYRSIGVNCVDIDDQNDAIILPDGKEVSGADGVKHESLYIRCLTKPTILNKKEQLKLMVIFLILLAGIGYLIYQGIMFEDKMTAIETAIKTMKSVGVVQ